MGQRILLTIIILWIFTGHVAAQQIPDPKFSPPVPRPAYEPEKGPRIAIDEAHHNFHTADGRYKPFAELVRRDGYRVDGFNKQFSAETLKGVNVLVIANPLNERNISDWSLPTPSAFTQDEIAAVQAWVKAGGSLFLIADHMPFPGAAGDLAKAFGIEFSNGYAVFGHHEQGKTDTVDSATGLKESVVTRGRTGEEKITKVATFGGSAFKLPNGATPVIVFGANSVSHETTKAPGVTPGAPKVPIEGWSQGAIMKYGKGRIAIFGEAAMFSAQLAGPAQQTMGMNAPDAKQNYQLLMNIMHWLTHAKGMPK
jgi:hypothetical protein